jgi:hypothetical protein
MPLLFLCPSVAVLRALLAAFWFLFLNGLTKGFCRDAGIFRPESERGGGIIEETSKGWNLGLIKHSLRWEMK